jgi:hypothetical protein
MRELSRQEVAVLGCVGYNTCNPTALTFLNHYLAEDYSNLPDAKWIA